jgi:type IV secretory pathway VirB2 component (pilin)
MNKVLLLVVLGIIIFAPFAVNAEGLVKCNGPDDCTLENFFQSLGEIYNFIVQKIATPLGVLAIMIGGIMMLISAGNPNTMSLGKKIFWSAVIGLLLVFGTKMIINLIIRAAGGSIRAV